MVVHEKVAKVLGIWLYVEIVNFLAWITISIIAIVSFHDRLIELLVGAFHVVAVVSVLAALEFIHTKEGQGIHVLSSALWYWPASTVIVTDGLSLAHAIITLLDEQPAFTTFSYFVVFFFGFLLFNTLAYVIMIGAIHWTTPTGGARRKHRLSRSSSE